MNIFIDSCNNNTVLSFRRYKMRNNINESIKCTVVSCKHHNNSKDYCCLDCITVGTHECNPTEDQCTDCLSFERN